MSLRGLLKIKGAGGDLNDLTKSLIVCLVSTLGGDDLPVVKVHAPGLVLVCSFQNSGEPRIFNCLNGVKDTYSHQVASECNRRRDPGVLIWLTRSDMPFRLT